MSKPRITRSELIALAIVMALLAAIMIVAHINPSERPAPYLATQTGQPDTLSVEQCDTITSTPKRKTKKAKRQAKGRKAHKEYQERNLLDERPQPADR